MGCQSNNYQHEHCVKETVRRIVRAQRKAAERDTVTCITSCERSIDDLLSPRREPERIRHTTIPFMLICKNGCKNFVGSGVIKRETLGGRPYFECIESPVFRARGFVRGSDSCVKLELLQPIKSVLPPGSYAEGGAETADEQRETSEASEASIITSPTSDCSPCSFFSTTGFQKVYGFRKTGVCITVDLNCFCGITCLDPITPAQA